MTHPSHWALDRARLGEVSEEVRAHLAGCATCRAAFAEREVVAVPAWVRQLERPRRRWWLAPGLGLATAALATLLLVVVPRPYVGEKGALPAVAVYLERGGAVAPWAGGALRAGDRLQLTVRPTGRAHVYLLAAGGAGCEVLHAETLGGSGEQALARGLTVDDAPGPETLVVLLSAAPLGLEVLQQPPRASTEAIWVEWLRFEKEKE